MQKVVVVREEKLEETEWDGTIHHLCKILNADKRNVEFNTDKLCVEDKMTYIEREDDYHSAFFDLDGNMRDQELIMVGLKNILDLEKIPTLQEVKNRVQFRKFGILQE